MELEPPKKKKPNKLELLNCPLQGTFSGNIHSLKIRKSFGSLLYYEGIARHVSKEEEDACFLVCPSVEKANIIHECSLVGTHPGIMDPKMFPFEENIEGQCKHIIQLDPFDGCLAKEGIMDSLFKKEANQVPGNPPKFLIENILLLMDAIKFMRENKLSSSCLNVPEGYVKCRNSGMIKILPLDLKVDPNNSEHHIRDLEHFMHILDKYILNHTSFSSWPEKDAFMRCFNNRSLRGLNLSFPELLKMMKEHHFLKWYILEILRFFPVAVWKNKWKDGKYCGRYLRPVWIKLEEIIGEKKWIKDWDDDFQRAFDGQHNPIKKTKELFEYENDNPQHLVKFLKDALSHIEDDENNMSVEVFYTGIKGYWPGIFDRAYERLYTWEGHNGESQGGFGQRQGGQGYGQGQGSVGERQGGQFGHGQDGQFGQGQGGQRFGLVERVEKRDYQPPSRDAKLFVRNLPYDVDCEQLVELFQQAGAVRTAEVKYIKETNQSRGFGFVTMRTVQDAEIAVEKLNGYVLDGRVLTVRKAIPRI